MSNPNYMPLHGALLISNPRNNSMARHNPNYARAIQKATRSSESQDKAAARKDLRATFRRKSQNWYNDPQLRGQYEQAASKMGISAKEMLAYVTELPAGTSSSKSVLKARAKQRRVLANDLSLIEGRTRGGKAKGYSKTRAGAYKWGKKRTKSRKTSTGKTMRGVRVDVDSLNAYRKARFGRKAGTGYYDADAPLNDRWGRYAGGQFNYQTGQPKGSGTLITQGFKPSTLPGHPIVRLPAERRRAAKKAAKNSPWIAHVKAFQKANGVSYKEALTLAGASYQKAKNNRGSWGAKRQYRSKHGLGALALDNYGALALDNYGALALDNRGFDVPFVGGVVVDTGKLALTGLAGAIGHAMLGDKVEEMISQIPVIGDFAVDAALPDWAPLGMGGMELDNTIIGAVTGLTTILITMIAGRKLGSSELTQYGAALGAGVIIAGPVIDYTNHIGGGGQMEGDDMGALALDNYGALALDNDGTFGDGMAYQIGSIVEGADADYGQCSLADAHYSGADFDVGEGQALLNGKSAFHKRYGHPSRRVSPYGGKRVGASHLAGQRGHRWGWLVKMIGWTNVQKLAAMPPAQRVATIKKLRSNALSTFKQLHLQHEEAVLAAPELMAAPGGPDGVSGAFSSYGSTIFGGASL